MEKLKSILNKYRHILAMLLILVTAAGVLGWVGYATLPDASTKSERVIVNDDYSTLTAQITGEQGIRQNIQVKAGTKLYGLSMNFHIFNRVQFGTVFVDLEDMSGNVLASASRDMTTVLDNTFKGFIFDNMVQARQDSSYAVHVYIQPQTAEDRIALWKSRTTYDGFELTENGQYADGTLALQYYTRHVGSDIYGFFAVLSAVCIAGLELVYVMVFIRKAKIHNVFALLSFTIGIMFCVFTPINGAPDEYVHFGTSYKLSNEWLGIDNIKSAEQVLVRECDAAMPLDGPVSYDSFRFQDMYRGLFSTSEGRTDMVAVNARFVKLFKPLYYAQTLGITVARLLNLGFVPLVLMGRFFNLMMYTALIWLAVKIIPVYKVTMALCALLPMSMQLAASFSYDAYIIAFALLFTAAVFRIAYSEKQAGIADITLAAVALCMLAPAKTIYITMGLLVFIIPARKFKSKKLAWAAKLAIFGVAALFWLSVNMSVVTTVLGSNAIQSTPDYTRLADTVQTEAEEPAEEAATDTAAAGLMYPYDIYMRANPRTEEELFWDPDGDLQPNGDSKYYFTVSYILSHLKQTVKLVMNTITTQSGHILQSVIGTRLGELIVVDLEASWIWFILIFLVLVLSVTRVRNQHTVHRGLPKWWGALIFLGITALTVAAGIMWTPINYETVFGIQGRYLLPALPLMVMFFENKLLTLEKNIDDILIYSILPLDIMVVLNVFMIMTGM